MTPTTKSYLRWTLFGLLFGALLSSWLSPRMIGWYFEPPVNIGLNCRPATEWAMRKLQIAQLFGMGIGAVLTLFLRSLFRKKSPTALTSNDL